MLNNNIPKIKALIVLTFSAFAFIQPQQLSADVTDLTPLAQTIVQQAQDGDNAALEKTVTDIAPEALAEIATEITANTKGDLRTTALQFMARAVARTTPLDELPETASVLAKAVGDANGLTTDTVDSTMQGLVDGVRNHPDLDDAEPAEINENLGPASYSAAAAFIDSAEANEEADVEKVAEAIARGGAAGLAVGGLAPELLRTLANDMLQGGVQAADDPNKPGVSRAMLRVWADVVPPELRNVLPDRTEMPPDVDEGDGEEDEEIEEPAEPVAPPPPANPVEPEDVSNF